MDELFFDKNIKPGLHTLEKEESVHLIKVLRKRKGDIVTFTNGMGLLYDATILEASPKSCLLEVGLGRDVEDSRDFWITMVVAPTKNISRFEWFLEKAVEIGVDEVIPLLTEHVERKNVNIERLEKIVISALKQSQKTSLPVLTDPMNLMEAIAYTSKHHQFLARLDGDDVPHFADAIGEQDSFAIFIGPEGDFSDAEKKLAVENGLLHVHLGPYRLRTETAAICACQTIHLMRRRK